MDSEVIETVKRLGLDFVGQVRKDLTAAIVLDYETNNRAEHYKGKFYFSSASGTLAVRVAAYMLGAPATVPPLVAALL